MSAKRAVSATRADKKSTKKGEISLVDGLALAETSIRSMKDFVDGLDSTIYREFLEIAQYIEKTKQEIGHLQANDLKSKHIPEAGHELSEVVTATEDATTQIMECAEAILDADTSDAEAYQQLVNDKVMVIFEACSFQDLTGQRISKVVETLEYIESRVSRFACAIGAKDKPGSLSEKEKKKKQRQEDLLLNGPAKTGEGVSQDDVDALLNG